MQERNGQPAGQPTPAQLPTAPLPQPALDAIARLHLRLNYPTDLYRATARYKIASAATTAAARRTDKRDLTDAELNDFQYMQDVMREAHTALANAGRLDLIGATA